MGFRKGFRYPHPPRGPARKPYHMSEAALRARRRNLEKARNRGKIKLWRGHDETQIIKLLIWQSWFDPEPRPSQRTLARKLCVRPSYVCKVQKKAITKGMDALTREGRRITLDDLAEPQRVSARMRERAPELFGPASASVPAIPEPHRSEPYRVIAEARTLEDWEKLERRGRRRVGFSIRVR